jgi:hypothetical protein
MLYRHHIFSVVARTNTATLPALDRPRPCGGILVATDGVIGRFEGNLANHADSAHAIEERDA